MAVNIYNYNKRYNEGIDNLINDFKQDLFKHLQDNYKLNIKQCEMIWDKCVYMWGEKPYELINNAQDFALWCYELIKLQDNAD